MQKVKYSAKQVYDDTKSVTQSMGEFVQALALLSVSIYAIWAAYYQYGLDYWTEYGLFAAGGLIMLQGTILLVRHFKG